MSLFQRWHQRLLLFLGFIPGHFLCDSCRYNFRHACRRPKRPNARECPEYSRR